MTEEQAEGQGEDQGEDTDEPLDLPESEPPFLRRWGVWATVKNLDGTEIHVSFGSHGNQGGDGVGLDHLGRFIEARLEAATESVRS